MSECKMTFLYEASKILPKNDCGKFIRSQLIAKLYTTDHVHLPAQNFKPSVMCRACGIQMTECPPKTIIEPPPKKNRLIRRVIRMLQDNKKLTKYQRDVIQAFQKKNHQKMTSTCKMCGNKVVTKIDKPEFKSKKPRIKWQEQVSKRSSKKKKKDAFSGLNKDAVLSVQPQPESVTVNVLRDKNDSHEIFVVAQTRKNPDTNANRGDDYPRQNNKQNKKQNKNNKRKNKSKFQHNRVEKNEVLKKTEKNLNKNIQRMKNLTNMLQGTQGTSGSLATFLKNL